MNLIIYLVIGVVVIGVLGFLYLALVWAPKQRKFNRQWLLRAMTHGEDHVAYVMHANESLYKQNGGEENYSYAQVVYCTDRGVPDLETELAGIAERLRRFKLENPEDFDERCIDSVMKSEVPLMRSLKLPPRIAGPRAAYTYSLLVHWDNFVEGKLTGRLLKIKVLPDESECHILCLPEPGSPMEEVHRKRLELARQEGSE